MNFEDEEESYRGRRRICQMSRCVNGKGPGGLLAGCVWARPLMNLDGQHARQTTQLTGVGCHLVG